MSETKADKRREKKAENPAWSGETHADDLTQIYLSEREFGKGVVRIRWTREDGTRPWVTIKGINIRNDRGGLAERQIVKAKAAARKLYDEWKNPKPVVVAEPEEPVYELENALELYLNPLTGRKMNAKTRKEAERAVAYVRSLRDAKSGSPLIDFKMPAGKWSQVECQVIWRTMLAERVALDKAMAEAGNREHKPGGGRRTAEYRVGVICSAVAWARKMNRLDAGSGRVEETWRESLAEEWAAATEVEWEVDRPRYTLGEARKIERALPKADPRMRLRYRLGCELRPVQVLRARRSDLSLEGGADGLGVFVVRGDGHKGGAVVDLDTDMRAEWERAVGPTGYLRRLEAAFLAGEIVDFYLFPQGKLVFGGDAEPAAPVERALTGNMDSGSMNDLWTDFETVAGVEHVPGRGMYGMRRLSVDLADDVTDDEAAKDALGGWAPGGGTRRKIYAEKHRRETSEKAARVRSKIRDLIRGDG